MGGGWGVGAVVGEVRRFLPTSEEMMFFFSINTVIKDAPPPLIRHPVIFLCDDIRLFYYS